MVEAETVTMAADMAHLLDLIELLYKSTLESVLRQSAADIQFYHNQITTSETKVQSFIVILSYILRL